MKQNKKYKTLNATITEDLYQKLKEEAKKEDASVSYVLRKILKEYFNKNK